MKNKHTKMNFPYPREKGIKFQFLKAFNFMLNFIITGVAQAGSIVPAFVIIYGFLASNPFVAAWVASLGLSAGIVTGMYIGTVAILFSILFLSYGLLYYSEADKALRTFLLDRKWVQVVNEVTDKYNETIDPSQEKALNSQLKPEESHKELMKPILDFLDAEIEKQKKKDLIKLLKTLQKELGTEDLKDEAVHTIKKAHKNDRISDRLYYLKYIREKIQLKKLDGFTEPALRKNALENILRKRPQNKENTTFDTTLNSVLENRIEVNKQSIDEYITTINVNNALISRHIEALKNESVSLESISKKEPWYRSLLKTLTLTTVGIITSLNAFLVNSFQIAFGALGILSLTPLHMSFTATAVLGSIFLIAGAVSSLALTQTALLALVHKMMDSNTIKKEKTNAKQSAKKPLSSFSKYLKIAMAFLYASASAGLNFAANLTSGYIILHINQLQHFGAASAYVLSHMATLNPWVIAFGALGGILTFCVSFPFTLDFLFESNQKNKKPSPQWVKSIRHLNVLSISLMLGAFTISSSSIWAVLGATQTIRLLIAAVLVPTVFYLCNKLFAKYTDPSFTALIPDRSLEQIAATKIQKAYRPYKALEVDKLRMKYKEELSDNARKALKIKARTSTEPSDLEKFKSIIKELRKQVPAPSLAFYKELESKETTEQKKSAMRFENTAAWDTQNNMEIQTLIGNLDKNDAKKHGIAIVTVIVDTKTTNRETVYI